MTFALCKRFLTSVTKSKLSPCHKKKHARQLRTYDTTDCFTCEGFRVKRGLATGACCHCALTIAEARVPGLRSIEGLIEDPSGP